MKENAFKRYVHTYTSWTNRNLLACPIQKVLDNPSMKMVPISLNLN